MGLSSFNRMREMAKKPTPETKEDKKQEEEKPKATKKPKQ